MTEQVLRKDAARNRERLIAAGRDLFAHGGLDVTLNDVARHAGVGIGTAYRRFTNKEELIDAIWEQQVDEMESILRDALGTPDPWEGLVLYLERSLDAQARDRGLAEILAGRVWPSHYDRQRDRLAPLVDEIADRAREAGVLREDVVGTDLILLQIAITAVSTTVNSNALPKRSNDVARLYSRYLAIVLDGLRASTRQSTLPVGPLTVEETHALLDPRRR
ncbi:TetR/AcrR family transcriptional regulator [Sinomonas terrae]|uniref:TetR/AcrR family transcriptional regulator n=1 Tax=Sinomonas terrae TaxID=2908838 RepID=A0ABS9U235_9MICC|nr:TetR/AcrR family transcriptional regulator [Sinomonas terrae]MCH6470754.1 TetR/AcrR family transcriptional regulator [Sinomonas terrae]